MLAGVATPLAHSADDWTFRLTGQGVYNAYSGSLTRSNLSGYGLVLDGVFRDRGGFAVGGDSVTMKARGGAQSISQGSGFVSGHVHMTPGGLPGRLTLRMDVMAANNNDATNESDQVRVWAPQLSYLSSGKSFYLDTGYADSRYGDSTTPARGTLRVRQWTPTVGFGFNQNADWLQLRVYDIHTSNALRSANKSRATAVEAKWTHYFTPGGWTPEYMSLGLMGGERIYALDPDTRTLYNLADRQKEGAFLSAQWKLGANTSLLLSTGHNRYETPLGAGLLTSTYSGTYGYAGLTYRW
jgi:hypothetical protein